MVEELRSSRRRAIRNVLIDAMILALALGLLALVRLPGSSVRPLPGQAPAERPSPSPQGVAPILTLTPIRIRGEVGHIGAYRGPTGDLCIELTTEGTISCDLAPHPGDALRLAYANWLYLDSPQYGLGVFVAGAVGPRVASVHVSLGAGRWTEATLLKPPPELGFPFRLFYIETKTGRQSLNSSLPVVARDRRGREVGRDHYSVCSLLTGGWCFRLFSEQGTLPSQPSGS